MTNLIILSPCKEMHTDSGNLPIQKHPYTESIVTYFASLSLSEIAHFFKVSDTLAQDILSYYQTFSWSHGNHAYKTYKGLAFRQIQWDDIDRDYAQTHLRILSALYGPIGPEQAIHPYRLDFMRPLKLQNKALKSQWKAQFSDQFLGHTIYNLASKEFSSLLPRKHCQMIDIEFYQSYPNKKASAAVAKKLRGALTSHILKHASFQQEVFETFAFEEYQLSVFQPDQGYIHYSLS